jgi:hypothetical protein
MDRPIITGLYCRPVIDRRRPEAYIAGMTLASLRRRTFAVMMAIAILIVGAPMLPASAAADCDHMAVSSMAMDMKSAPSQEMPAKPGLPCTDNLTCLGGAGCAAPSFDQLSVASLPSIATADANWSSRLGGPSIAYKPALPPPIA